MAEETKLREISIAEFFEKNRHLLGFDNPAKAILTVVKEAVDNSLDACELARILPDVLVEIREARRIFKVYDESGVALAEIVLEADRAELHVEDRILKPSEMKESNDEKTFVFEDNERTYKFKIQGKGDAEKYLFLSGRKELKVVKMPQDRFVIVVEDNGPGISKEHVARVFGKLLYGSKFGAGMQSRGQQGIGISAALLYAQLTTGKPAKIWSKTEKSKSTYYCEIRMDTMKNEPIIISEKDIKDGKEHGVRIELEIEGKFVGGSHSVEEYLRQTLITNPHLSLTFIKPDGEKLFFKRTSETLPQLPKAIKPHPHGVELGVFERMLKATSSRTLAGFLSNDFSRVSPNTAEQVCKLASLKPSIKPSELTHVQIEKIWKIMQTFDFMKPPTDCLSPIGEESFIAGLKREYQADYFVATTRQPVVYRGNPFQIEVCIGYGGKLPQNESAKIIRIANRVPLIYQASSCAITKAIQKIDWRHYGIDVQNGMPFGPVIIAVHMASVWIPYTSESKEAIDPYPVVLKEIKLALQDTARKLQRYLAGKRRREEAAQRINLFEKYLKEASEGIASIAEVDSNTVLTGLKKILKHGNLGGEENGEQRGSEKEDKGNGT